MSPGKALSWNATLVLEAIARGHAYGFEIMNETTLPSGTVYPLLRRLESSGLLESAWEEEDRAHAEGRPARRYYRATEDGLSSLAEARERLAEQQRFLGDVAAGEVSGS